MRSHFSRNGLADRVALVRRVVDERRDPDDGRPLLNALLQALIVTDDREYVARSLAQRQRASYLEILTCPFLAIGSVEEIAGQLTRLQEDFGIDYVTVFNQHADDAATVLRELGRTDAA